MAYFLVTTGTQTSFSVASLGALPVTHPATINLTEEFNNKNDELLANTELIGYQNLGWITIEDQNGTPAPLDLPVGSDLGSREAWEEITMTGNLTFTKANASRLYLDPDGVNREITIPVNTDAVGTHFFIVNIGTTSAYIDLFVSGDGSRSARILPQKAVECHATSVDWTIFDIK